jgi:ceramide glucosyltransferase
MMSAGLVLVTAVGWMLVLVMYASQRRLVRQKRPPASATTRPPISILKPLKGADPDLESNLRSYYLLEYPAFEILFGVQDPRDAGLAVARRVASSFPDVPTTFVVDDREVGFNPKVNNLANIAGCATHELMVISDSNVRVGPDHLDVLMERLRPEVGLVTAPVRARGGRGVGGMIERAQLNTFVMGGVAAVNRIGMACAMGKTMLFRRTDLERVGGFAELGRYLAEDQVLAEEINRLGLRSVVSAQPVDQHLGRLTVRQFASRHLRWARLRCRLAPAGYTAEVLTNPHVPAGLLLAVDPGALSAAVVGLTVGLATAVGFAADRLLGVRGPLLTRPLIEIGRAALLAVLWPVPYVSSSVTWRGRRYRIGRRTRLHPDQPAWVPVEDPQPEEAAA